MFKGLGAHRQQLMASARITCTQSLVASKLQIAQAFFGSMCCKAQIEALEKYFEYYNDELELLRRGISVASWQLNSLAVKTSEDVFYVVDLLRDGGDSRRSDIRQRMLLRFSSSDVVGMNRSINLAIRLWLMINTQDPEFSGLRHEATPVQWDDESTLLAFLQSLFPPSQWPMSAQSSRLGPHFTAAFMKDVCGLTIEWTTSLHDHLRLDRFRKALKIFPYKCHLQALIESQKMNSDKKKYVQNSVVSRCNRLTGFFRPLLALTVLEETKLSLDLLFPFWDSRTITLLVNEKQNFHEYGSFEATKTLNLMDFDHWRDRLLELHEEIFLSPPISWAQLWRDRRSPQQFWTFWIAIMILILTVFSTVATVIQAWASLKALG